MFGVLGDRAVCDDREVNRRYGSMGCEITTTVTNSNIIQRYPSARTLRKAANDGQIIVTIWI